MCDVTICSLLSDICFRLRQQLTICSLVMLPAVDIIPTLSVTRAIYNSLLLHLPTLSVTRAIYYPLLLDLPIVSVSRAILCKYTMNSSTKRILSIIMLRKSLRRYKGGTILSTLCHSIRYAINLCLCASGSICFVLLLISF